MHQYLQPSTVRAKTLRKFAQSFMIESKRLLRLVTVLGCCLGLTLTGCGTLSNMELDSSEFAPAHQTEKIDLQREVDSLVQPLIEKGHTPGMVVGVLLPDGDTHFFGYGTRNKPGDSAPDADTLFAIGSLSKGFLAAITELLVAEGTLSWEDTLGDLLPPGTPLSPQARGITLLQLATHTSGLPRQPFNTTTFKQFIQYLFTGESFYQQFDRNFVFDYLTNFESSDIGKTQYSNIGYGLIGQILEYRTGLTVDELFERKLATALKLSCTSYTAELLPCYPTRARGHAGDQPKFIPRGQVVPDWQFTNFMRGSAGLHSNARDILTFAAAHMKGSETPFHAALRDALEVRIKRPKEAAAVAWIADEFGKFRINYQIGLVAGFTSYIGLIAEQNIAVVVLQNSFNWDNTLGHKLLLRLAHLETDEYLKYASQQAIAD